MTKNRTASGFFFTKGTDIFLEAGRTKSFSQAAQNFGISQSSVSQSIRHLENELCVTLFERDKRPLKMTPEGEVLYKKLLNDKNETQHLIEQIRSTNYLKPVVSLGIIESVASVIGVDLAMNLKNLVGQLRLAVSTSEKLVDDVYNLNLDIAILSSPIIRDESLRWYLLYEEPWVTIFPESYKVKGNETTWEGLRLCGLPFIAHGKDTANDRYFKGITGNELQGVSTLYEIDNNFMMYQFVKEGLGWSITQAYGVLSFMSLSGLTILRPPQSLPKRKVFLVARKTVEKQVVDTIYQIVKGNMKKRIQELLGPQIPWIVNEFDFSFETEEQS